MQVEIKIIRGEQFKEITVQSTERTFYMYDDILQNYDNGVVKESTMGLQTMSSRTRTTR